MKSSERVWWLRPSRVPRVLAARLEVSRWRRRHRMLETHAELAGGRHDGLLLDELRCPRCERLVPVGECRWIGSELHHAPHRGRGHTAALARRRGPQAAP